MLEVAPSSTVAGVVDFHRRCVINGGDAEGDGFQRSW